MTASFFLIIMMHFMGGMGFFSVMAVLPGVLLALLWAAPLGEILGGGVSGFLTGSGQMVEERPYFSVAETRRMKGDYAGAIKEIGKQLGKFPGDFEGQILLANIQMENLRDFEAAQTTLQNIADQTHQKTGNVAYALTMLADWQLKFARDQAAARATLEGLMGRFPNTGVELRVAQRVARMDNAFEVNDPSDTGSLVSGCLKHLERHPLDNNTREVLARIYHERYGRSDLAEAELDRLINQPYQSKKDVARWLNLAADWHEKAGDLERARKCLKNIIERMPNTAQAKKSQDRLSRMHDARST
jgi:tetratricopeptide (TPR) repeat protein